ncbi:MAG: UbiD family decarboxylase [Pseudonocardiales bacterium]|nr:UbiD family decarboxylase [Pseudonocardiales bacterium]
MGAGSSQDLRSYLDELTRDHPEELLRVDQRVSSDHERSAVLKALEPFGTPAVMFDNVAESSMPVLMGLFGTRNRIADALGVSVADCDEYVLGVPSRLNEPVHVLDAPVQQERQLGADVDLATLPIGVHSRDDAGRYITSGVTVARDPATGNVNTGIYRIMITGRNTLTMNAAPDHDLGRVIRAAAAEGRSVDFAIVIGHHPAFAISSQLKHPIAVDSYASASSLLREPLELVDGLTIDLPVPARAEIVLEGRIDTANWVPEGPFGEFTYYYGSAQAPECTITAITHRTNAIFNDLHPTHNEHRCLWLFPGRQARLLAAVRAAVPGVRAVRLPSHGGALSAYIALSKRHSGDGRTALLAAFATDHFLKYAVVVDDDIDITDDEQVHWAVTVRTQPDEDVMTVSKARGIRMDPTAFRVPGLTPPQVLTAKQGIDATQPLGDGAFPVRADLPPIGFENLDLTDYLPIETVRTLTEDQARLSRRTH